VDERRWMHGTAVESRGTSFGDWFWGNLFGNLLSRMAKTQQQKTTPATGQAARENAGVAAQRPVSASLAAEEAVESTVEHLVKTYGPTVALGVCLVVVTLAAWAWFVTQREQTQSGYWDAISSGVGSGSVPALVSTAEEARGSLVGVVAMQNAAVVELNGGLEKMIRDRDRGKQEIRSAIEKFQQVLDSPQATDMLRQQAQYGMAFAREAVGEFDRALEFYRILAEDDDSPYQRLARDGQRRCQDDQIKEFFTAFSNWQPATEDSAPGDLLPGFFDQPSSGFNLDPADRLLLEDDPPPVPPTGEDGVDAEEGDEGDTGAGDTGAGDTHEADQQRDTGGQDQSGR